MEKSTEKSAKEYSIPDNNNSWDVMRDYVESLADPKDLHSGEPVYLPLFLHEKWGDLQSLEENYYTEQRFYHPDERKKYEKAIIEARKDFDKSLKIAYQNYVKSFFMEVSEQDLDYSKKSLTPMDQYDRMKSQYPDVILLFRHRDTYRTYREDAINAAPIFGLDIKDIKVHGKKVKITEFPHDSIDIYLTKLVQADMRVAICDPLENLRKKKTEKVFQDNISKYTDMAKKKTEKVSEVESTKTKTKTQAKTKNKTKPKAKIESKAEVETEQKSEVLPEKQIHKPQMVTVNGDKVTHGHSFQSKYNPENWYFTAKINGEQLKPQLMTPEDIAAFSRKEITVPQLMERYYPTKLLPQLSPEEFKAGTVLSDGRKIDKFNVYREKNPESLHYNEWRFYCQVGDEKHSVQPSKHDLSAYFDRTSTPAQLVEKYFGETLGLASAYSKYVLPEGVEESNCKISKSKTNNKCWISVSISEHGVTEKKELSYYDRKHYFDTKTATKGQLAAKYLSKEILQLLATKREESITTQNALKL